MMCLLMGMQCSEVVSRIVCDLDDDGRLLGCWREGNSPSESGPIVPQSFPRPPFSNRSLEKDRSAFVELNGSNRRPPECDFGVKRRRTGSYNQQSFPR